MKILSILVVCAAMSSVARAQSLQDCYNNVGIFNSDQLDLEQLDYSDYTHNGHVGVITVYIVLINPYNENTGELVSTVGGYEFRVGVPGGLFVTPILPSGSNNFLEFPDLYCEASLPVVNNQCVLLTLEIGFFTQDPRLFYITPVSDASTQSIPGDIAITDAGDEHSLSRATPIFADFELPVYAMFDFPIKAGSEVGNVWSECWAVPAQPASWGDVKAMYR